MKNKRIVSNFIYNILHEVFMHSRLFIILNLYIKIVEQWGIYSVIFLYNFWYA
jgi:hypothetical protein